MTDAKSWPFEQARALFKKVGPKNLVTFQTGYGPSGHPHLGTFGEVVRTQMVRNAFHKLIGSDIATRTLVFSDDYDGFRRVPDGLPESMFDDIGKPLTSVRDPYGEYPSFAHRNNAALVNFIERMDFDVTFVSATDCYKSGIFNPTLLRVLENYEAIKNLMLSTLGEVRRETYSPFMPISPVTGNVLAEGVLEVDKVSGEILFVAEDGKEYSVPVIDGNAKLQWKVDWAMRWAAFDVDYEMHGKDLLDSASLSSKISKIISNRAPLNYFYELFLDDSGHKISKSKGNGFSLEQWLQYSSTGALAYYMFQSPRSAKAFGASIVPRATDDYLKALGNFKNLDKNAKLDSPVWHIHGGNPPSYDADVSYGLLLNLATVSNAQDAQTLEKYLSQYKAVSDKDREFVGSLIPGAISYAQAYILKNRKTRAPTDLEHKAFLALADKLETMADGLPPEIYQTEVYAIGKDFEFTPLRAWFQGLYEVLFGDSQGPRFGSFIAAYGREETIKLLRAV